MLMLSSEESGSTAMCFTIYLLLIFKTKEEG